MNGLERKVTPNLNPSEVLECITTLYAGDVIESMHFIENNPLLVVTGPIGIGKSTSFIPLLSKSLTDHGFNVCLFDWQNYDDADDTRGIIEAEVDKLPDTTKGVLIIDEARPIIDDGENVTQYVLETSHRKKYRVVPVIPYYYGQENTKYKYISAYSSVEKRISDHTGATYNLSSKVLDPSLAKDYLKIRGCSSEVIDALMRILPFKLVFLSQHWETMNSAEAVAHISTMYRPMLEEDLLITREDFNHIERTLKVYSQRAGSNPVSSAT